MALRDVPAELLLEPILKDKGRFERFFSSLRRRSLQMLAIKFYLTESNSVLVFEKMLDQLLEKKISGFRVEETCSAIEYDRELEKYLVYQIVKRRAIDFTSSKYSQMNVSLENLSNGSDACLEDVIDGLLGFENLDSIGSDYENVQTLEKLRHCVGGLSTKLQQVFNLLLMDNTNVEIGRILDIPAVTVGTRINEGIRRLRQCLKIHKVME